MFSNKFKKLLIIGISGVTCGGKTTLANQLKNVLPNCTVFSQDDYFRDVTDPAHIWVAELNHINFDIISSLDMEKMFKDVLKFINNNNFVVPGKMVDDSEKNSFYSSSSNKNNAVCDKIGIDDVHVLIIEGFSIFNYEKWLYLFNLKYYFTLDKEECYKRRTKRIYEPPDCPGYFEKVAWPEYLISMEEVKVSVKDVNFFDNIEEHFFKKILKDITEYTNDIF